MTSSKVRERQDRLDDVRARAQVFRETLLEWWAANERWFPWREDRDPYRILIAELMLRRTRADQAARVYSRFIERYPDLAAFSRARAEEVYALLQPLGLRWRADNIVALIEPCAREGPSLLSPDRIEQLPGVGPYVAAAVKSLAFGECVPIVDTNTSRVVTRVFSLPPQREARRSWIVRTALSILVDPRRPRDFNLALLDFAAIVCGARKPRCASCPMTPFCDHGRASSRIVPGTGCGYGGNRQDAGTTG